MLAESMMPYSPISVQRTEQALTKALEPYWQDPGRLRSLAGFSWWVETIEPLAFDQY